MQVVKYISILLLMLGVSMAHAQEVAYFPLAGAQLGSNTVYDLHALDNGGMVAATDHGVAVITMGGVKMLTSQSALRNSYTAIQRDSANNLYALNFRNQLYRLGTDSLELVFDFTKEFNERVLGYGFWGETLLAYTNTECKRFYLDSHEPFEDWNRAIARQLEHRPGSFFAVLETSSDSSLFFGNTTVVGDTLLFSLLLQSARSGERYYDFGHQRFVLRSELGRVVVLPAGHTIDCTPYIEGDKFHNVGFTSQHFWVAGVGGLLLYNEPEPDEIPRLLLQGQAISCLNEDLQGNYWIGTLSNGIYIVPSVAITRFTPGQNNDGIYTAIAPVPGLDSIVAGIKTGQLVGIGESNVVQPLAELPVIELHDLKLAHGSLYAAAGGQFLRLHEGQVSALPGGGISKNVSLTNTAVLAYSWYSISTVPRSFSVDEPANFPLLPQLNPDPRYPDLLGNEPFQRLWTRADGTGLLGANMGRCKRATDAGLAYIDSLDGRPLKVVDIAVDARNLGYVLTTEGAVYQIDSTSLDLIPVVQFECNAVPERLSVRGSLLLVYSGGELLSINLHDGIQHRFRDLMPFQSSELVDLAITPNYAWLGYSSAIFKVPLTELAQETPPLVQPLKLEGLEASNGSYALKANPGPIRVRLCYSDLLAKDQLQYSYRINKEDWILTERTADVLTLTNLAAGKYVLHVRVKSGAAVVNERSVSFTIAPRWYETIWFMAVVVVVVFCATVLFFRTRIRALKKRNAVNQQLNEAQLTALKAQMNPHFLFNVLNSMQTMVLKEDKIKANKIMSELSVFVRKILNYSGKAHIPVQAEVEMLQNYLKLEKHRFNDDFTYKLVVDKSVEDCLHMHIPPMLIQPFIENAINHGLLHKKHERKLSVHFSGNNTLLTCVLEDNGVGRKRAAELQKHSKKHRSFASSASARRIALLKDAGHSGASIHIEDLFHSNQQAAGTRVTITLPLTHPT